MHQSLDQQDVLPFNLRFVAEEDLHDIAGRSRLRTAVPRLDELAHDSNINGPHQIGQEHERVLKNSQHLDRLALIVVRDLPSQILHAFLNLLARDDLPHGLASVHECLSWSRSKASRSKAVSTTTRASHP